MTMGFVRQPLAMRDKRMRGTAFALVVISILSFAPGAAAHPVPFSYLDIRIQSGAIELTLVAHMFDVAHELGIDPNQILDPSVLIPQGDAVLALLRKRLEITADGRPLT